VARFPWGILAGA